MHHGPGGRAGCPCLATCSGDQQLTTVLRALGRSAQLRNKPKRCWHLSVADPWDGKGQTQHAIAEISTHGTHQSMLSGNDVHSYKQTIVPMPLFGDRERLFFHPLNWRTVVCGPSHLRLSARPKAPRSEKGQLGHGHGRHFTMACFISRRAVQKRATGLKRNQEHGQRTPLWHLFWSLSMWSRRFGQEDVWQPFGQILISIDACGRFGRWVIWEGTGDEQPGVRRVKPGAEGATRS